MLLVVVLELEDDLLSDGAPIIISRKPIPSSSSLSLGKVTLAGAGAGALGGGTGMGGGPRLLPPLSLTPSAALESKGGAGGEAAGSITGWAASARQARMGGVPGPARRYGLWSSVSSWHAARVWGGSWWALLCRTLRSALVPGLSISSLVTSG